MFPKEALTEDHFQGLGKIVPEAPGSLHVLMNAMRSQMNSGAYYVHPTADGAFPTIEEAVAQAELDHIAGSEAIVILLAQGLEHAITVAGGLIIDTTNFYYFVAAAADDNLYKAPTKISGDMDLKVTTKVSSSIRRPVIFQNISCYGMEITVRSGRRLVFNNIFNDNMKVHVEHGADGVDLACINMRGEGNFAITALDLPASPVSNFRALNSKFVGAAVVSPFWSVGGFLTIAAERCAWAIFINGTQPIFDLEGKSVSLTLLDTRMTIGATGGTCNVFSNATSGTCRWDGINFLERSANVGTTPKTFVLTGPTHEKAPWVQSGISPTGPPNGTQKFDDSDDAGSWTWLAWNGSTWV